MSIAKTRNKRIRLSNHHCLLFLLHLPGYPCGAPRNTTSSVLIRLLLECL